MGHYANECPERKSQKDEQAHLASTEREYIGMIISDESTIHPSSSEETTTSSSQGQNSSLDTSITTTSTTTDLSTDNSFTEDQSIDFRRQQFQRVSNNPLFQPPTNVHFNSANPDDLIPAEEPFQQPHPDVPHQQLYAHTQAHEHNTYVYPHTSMSRMLQFRRVTETRMDRYYRVMNHCTIISTLAQTGFFGQLPTNEKALIYNEIFAYHQMVNRIFRDYLIVDTIEKDFTLKMAFEVRNCIKLLATKRNTSSDRADTQLYWESQQEDVNNEFLALQALTPTPSTSNPPPTSTDGNNINNWGLDSGATKHFTNNKNDLTNAQPCNIAVTIADGSVVNGTLKGDVKLNITTNNGKSSTLTLKNVIFIEGLNRRLFSVMAFCNNPNYSVSFTHEGGRLDFGDGHSVSTTYAVFRPHEQEMVHETIDSKSQTFEPQSTSINNSTVVPPTVEGEVDNDDILYLLKTTFRKYNYLLIQIQEETK